MCTKCFTSPVRYLLWRHNLDHPLSMRPRYTVGSANCEQSSDQRCVCACTICGNHDHSQANHSVSYTFFLFQKCKWTKGTQWQASMMKNFSAGSALRHSNAIACRCSMMRVTAGQQPHVCGCRRATYVYTYNIYITCISALSKISQVKMCTCWGARQES